MEDESPGSKPKRKVIQVGDESEDDKKGKAK